MTAPHKATERQWGIVRRRAEDDYDADSVLLEVADRVAALEAAATKPPAPTADHSRGATEMVATDEKLWSLWASHVDLSAPADNALRAVYNLGRQHGAQSRQEEEAAPSPTHDLASDAPLLWVLWHHLGASSPVGQPIRRYLGMGQHDRMTSKQMAAATRWARKSTPQPAPAGDPEAVPSGLVERVLSQLPRGTDPVFARQAILEVAEWADEEDLFRTRRRLREEAVGPTAQTTTPATPTGGLVEKLASVWSEGKPLHPVACCHALHLVADWLETQQESPFGSASRMRRAVAMLRREADR